MVEAQNGWGNGENCERACELRRLVEGGGRDGKNKQEASDQKTSADINQLDNGLELRCIAIAILNQKAIGAGI